MTNEQLAVLLTAISEQMENALAEAHAALEDNDLSRAEERHYIGPPNEYGEIPYGHQFDRNPEHWETRPTGEFTALRPIVGVIKWLEHYTKMLGLPKNNRVIK
jgi:hypothetical protein